jgi:four helix bundle protein
MEASSNHITAEELKVRTKQFALRTIKAYRALPRTEEARIIGNQMLRSGTSVGANYRASCQARSDKEFLSRISVVLEETDETAFWFELLVEAEIMTQKQMSELLDEAGQLSKIFGATQRSMKTKLRNASARKIRNRK